MSDTDEQARTRALQAYRVLDEPPRRELTALVEMAAKFIGVPKATINLLTDLEQVQVATWGFEGKRVRKQDSLCVTVAEERQPVLLSDARQDPRFADNPHTTGDLDNFRFYGAHPLITPEGVAIGTLCVYDEQAHPVTSEMMRTLEVLAARVVDVLELELTSRRLEAANERLAAFAGQVSHDLKNPLAAVQMSLELAVEEFGEAADPALVALLGRAQRSTGRMDSMISDLLSFASVGASPSLVDVDLASTLDHVVEDLEAAAAEGQVTGMNLPVVRGDEVQLRVVLQNLVANALKFSPPGSPVVVAGEERDQCWRITVTDRGPGVPLEQRERVFDPMVRLDHGVSGSGIGLATCRRIVESHHGRIDLTDHPEGGAVVWFELPR